jgi:predicted nucleotidyltransferase
MNPRALVSARRDSIRATARAYGVTDIRLFGSVARGESRPDSEIDFLVSLAPGKTLLDLAKLELALERLLGMRVDVVTADGLREPVRSDALREAVRV